MNARKEYPSILTHTGQYFDFVRPELYVLDVADIAHALSHVCRFAGHCDCFYSVAEHSYFVSHLVPREDAFAALFHDCAEAFLGDVSRPLKSLLPDYRVLEKRIESVLFASLGIKTPLPVSIKHADLIMLATEEKALMPKHEDEWPVLSNVRPSSRIRIRGLAPTDAYLLFMSRYEELKK